MPYRKKLVKGKWTGSWVFDMRIAGKRLRKTVIAKSKTKADELYRNWVRKTDLHYGDVSENLMLFEIFNEFLEYAKKTKSESSYQRYTFTLNLLKECFINMKLNDFKSYHIDDYKIWRRERTFTSQSKKASNVTLNRDITMLSNFFNYCIERDYYKLHNPTFRKKLKEQQRRVRLNNEQVSELLEKSIGHIRTAVCLAIFAGLRRGEICMLKWDYIDLEDNRIDLPANITKSKKYRAVYIPQFLTDYLVDLKAKTDNLEYVLSYNGKSVNNFIKIWNKVRDTLTFKILPDGLLIHFHDLRHVYGQSLKDAGVPLADIQSLMGHHSVTTTEKHYANMSGLYLKDKVEKLTDVFDVPPHLLN